MNFSEGSYYKLQKDYYEHIKLECTYVEGNTAYFKLSGDDQSLGAEYKLNIKSGKLYKWDTKFQSWDSVENTLSEYGPSEIWDFRKMKNVNNYLE